MPVNYESVNEQLTIIVNQLGQLRRMFQKEIDAANRPATDAVALQEENARLRAELDAQRQSESDVRVAMRESNARLATRESQIPASGTPEKVERPAQATQAQAPKTTK